MAARFIIGIAALVCMSICGIMSTLVSNQIVDKVNDKLVTGEQFEPLGWHLTKRWQLHRAYRRSYPDGPLLLKLRVLMILAIFCLLTLAWSIGFLAS